MSYIKVDYAKKLKNLIKAGKYDYVNPSITDENFPNNLTKKQTLEVNLYHPNKYMSSGDVIKELERKNLRPATMIELAHFGIQYPAEQRRFPIVALGSVWVGPNWAGPNGDRYVGYLWESSGFRRLSLSRFDYGWVAAWRFLAVCKSDLDPSDPSPPLGNLELKLDAVIINGTKYVLAEDE